MNKTESKLLYEKKNKKNKSEIIASTFLSSQKKITNKKNRKENRNQNIHLYLFLGYLPSIHIPPRSPRAKSLPNAIAVQRSILFPPPPSPRNPRSRIIHRRVFQSRGTRRGILVNASTTWRVSFEINRETSSRWKPDKLVRCTCVT